MATSTATVTLRATPRRDEGMTRLSRRTFIGLSAATAGAAAFTRLPNLMRSAMAMAPASGSPDAVKHVVVLMQENRSFDHYFGTLPGVRGFADRTALRRLDGSCVFDQRDADDRFVAPFLPDTAAAMRDLDHSWQGTHAAWNGGHYDGWIGAKGNGCMAYLDRAAIPYHFELADRFTVCDNYFCSVMGATKPNRLYLWSGTCDPDGFAGGPAIDNSGDDFRWTTYPERLQAAGVDWKVYQNADDNYDDNALAWFSAFKNAKPGSALFERGVASVPRVHGDTCADIVTAIEHDVANGTLPFASWIVASETCSEHPSHSPANGADFIGRVLAALMADPEVWASTVLLINYDENDGFFDHVPPPVPPRGTPGEFVAGLPVGLGPRVPMLVVSPWSTGGYVCSQVFDHTSVIRFMEMLTGVREPNISRWRRSVCGDLMSAFDFTSTRIAVSKSDDVVRRARAIPYQCNANAVVDRHGRTLALTFANAGAESAHFAVHVDSREAPQHVDVSAQDGIVSRIVHLPDDGYDIAVHGANGFLRHFSGTPNGHGIHIECAIDDAMSRFMLTVINARSDAQSLRVSPNAYAPASKGRTVDAGQTARFDVELMRGWYDVTLALDAASDFRWRFAGHVENGVESVSG